MQRRTWTGKSLICLCSAIIFIGTSHAVNTYMASVYKQTDVNITSMVPTGLQVGKTPVSLTTYTYDRMVAIRSESTNTQPVWFSYSSRLSTWTVHGSSVTAFDLQPGETIYPIFRGITWFLNGDMSQSSSTIRVLIERDK